MVTRRSERVNLNVMEFSQDLRILPQSFKQWINCHPEDKHQQNVLCYSAERDLSTEWCYPPSELLGPWHFSKSQRTSKSKVLSHTLKRYGLKTQLSHLDKRSVQIHQLADLVAKKSPITKGIHRFKT